MKRSALIVLAAVAAMISPVAAADLGARPVLKAAPAPVVEAPAFAGLYAGINAGYGWRSDDASISGGNALSQAIVDLGLIPATQNMAGRGPVAGGQLGYNFMLTPVVLVGVEGDFQWADIKADGSKSLGNVGLLGVRIDNATSASLEWFGTARGRIGFLPAPGLLLYGTGGVAFGKVGLDHSVALVTAGPSFAAAGSTSATKTGWVAGVGAEYVVTKNLSLKAEYLRVNLGNVETGFGTAAFGPDLKWTASQKAAFDIVRAGVNFHFNP